MAAKMAVSEPNEKKKRGYKMEITLIKHNQLFIFHEES